MITRTEKKKLNSMINHLLDRDLSRSDKWFIIDFRYHLRKREINSMESRQIVKLRDLYKSYGNNEYNYICRENIPRGKLEL